ncbi:MAG: GNAT family N-acetyltransferase [Ilumatobacter sp.]
MGMPQFESITTERLVVRPMRADDVESLWERRNDPTTARFQNWTLPYARERAQELVDGVVALDGVPPANGWMQLAVDLRETGVVCGDLAIGFTFDGRCAEIGCSLDADVRSGGVATEAAEALVAWLFETAGVSRVSAMMHPDNLASVRVVEHLGLVFEGHTRNSYWVGDENSDDWIYGMTPEMWRAWVDRPRTPPESVDLVEITPANLLAVERLATHHSQRRFVAPMTGSFADALVPAPHDGHAVVPWLRAITADDDVAGFVMLTSPTDAHPNPYLWRLLIDRMHQRRGIGGRAVDLVVEWARELGAESIDVSYVEGPGSPEPLYRKRGFAPTGEIDDGETVARLEF